jgi:RecG-like helicase
LYIVISHKFKSTYKLFCIRTHDKKSKEYIQVILEDVNDLINIMTLEIHDYIKNVKCGHYEEDAYVSTHNEVKFIGFEQLNNNLLKIEDQLICDCANLRIVFKNFQKKYKQILLNYRHKKVKKKNIK